MYTPTFTTKDLFQNALVSSPRTIHAEWAENRFEATLNGDGSVNFADKQFADIDAAMNFLPHAQQSTSNAWQFWTWFSPERQTWTPLEHLRAQLAKQKKPAEIRTSETHPLRIDHVSVPHAAGKIGLTFCPGKNCEGLYGGTWQRDLASDINAIENWGGQTLISLMEMPEFSLLGVPQFPELVERSSLKWLHLPIRDMHIPDADFEKRWHSIGPSLHRQLKEGQSIVIHCRGGLGRTGLLAARMLCEAGLAPAEAVAKIRAARVNSIETYAQEHYVLTQAWVLTQSCQKSSSDIGNPPTT